jgi:hypothetical protein
MALDLRSLDSTVHGFVRPITVVVVSESAEPVEPLHTYLYIYSECNS